MTYLPTTMQSFLPELFGPPRPTPSFRIRASFAKLAATAKAETDIRYYLNGILVEPREGGGAYIVATTGHHLIAIIDPHAKVTMPVVFNPAKSLLSACPKVGGRDDTDDTILELTSLRDQPVLLLTKGEEMLAAGVGRTIIDGVSKFPDWRRILPDFSQLKRGVKGEFCQAYLAAPFKAMDTRYCYGGAADCWQVPNELDHQEPVMVRRLNGRNDIVHLVMPRRRDNGDLVWISNFSDAKRQGAKP